MYSSADHISMPEVGDLIETGGEITFEWQIKNFESLSDENIGYASPRFYFSGACWRLEIFPNGGPEKDTEDIITLYLSKQSSDSPVSVKFSLHLKLADGIFDIGLYNKVFNVTNDRFGQGLRSRSGLLMRRKEKYLPSGILTVICTMKSIEPKDAGESYFSRLLEVSDNFKDIYQQKKETDFSVIVQGPEVIDVHRVILETRSPVFGAMLSHDTEENRNDEVIIGDLDKSAIDNIFCYIYSGDIRGLTTENALSVYAAADKYDVKYVKKVCVQFIMETLSTEWVCDVIKFADLYNEEELGSCAKELFLKNAKEILDSEQWKSFIDKHPKMGNELLSSIVEYSSRNYSQ